MEEKKIEQWNGAIRQMVNSFPTSEDDCLLIIKGHSLNQDELTVNMEASDNMDLLRDSMLMMMDDSNFLCSLILDVACHRLKDDDVNRGLFLEYLHE